MTGKFKISALVIAVLIGTLTGRAGNAASTDTLSQPANPKTNPVKIATSMIQERNYTGAKTVLENLVKQMPHGWTPLRESEKVIEGCFWDKDEYISCSDYYAARKQVPRKRVGWLTEPSYSEAYFNLGWLAVERKDYKAALGYLDEALKLEANHPSVLIEKGYVLQQMGRSKEALEAFGKVLTTREWTTQKIRARAMRGSASVFMSLKQWKQAEAALRKSLEIDPGNDQAQKTLARLRKIKSDASTPEKTLKEK
jgi:tetratricopeptide (TPR) repeat protein